MPDNQISILEDNSDNNVQRLEKLINHLSLSRPHNSRVRPRLDPVSRLGIFSRLLAIPNFELYDNKNLLEKFPNGFVTETMIGIPLKSFIDLRNSFSEQRYEFTLADFITSYMSAFIDKNLGIKINKKDKEVILNEYYNAEYSEERLIEMEQNLLDVNPNKSSNIEIAEIIKGDNYNITSKLNSSFNMKEFLDVLIDNKEDAKKVPSLSKFIRNQKHRITKPNENISIEDFKDLINKNENTVEPLRIVLKKMESIKKEAGEDFNKFIELSISKLPQFIAALPQLSFNMAIVDFSDKFIEKFKTEPERLSEFSKHIYEEIKTDPLKVSFLIRGITGYQAIESYDFRSQKERIEDDKLEMAKKKIKKT